MLARLLIAAFVVSAIQGCIPTDSNFRMGSSAATELSARRTVTVRPTEIDDILYNPGMGFADFHFGIGPPLPVEQHPRSTVAYVRWYWTELEPAEGQYNFALVDG